MANHIDFKKQNIPFTMVANGVLYDISLSMGSKCLYAYLYSKPDGWDFSAVRIGQELGVTEPTILKYIHELEKAGYLKRERQSTGRVTYMVIYPPIEPHTKNFSVVSEPHTKKARLKKSQTEKSLVLSNTDTKVILKDISNTIVETSSTGDKVEFDWESYLQGMLEHQRKDLNIIGFFFKVKKIKFTTKEKAEVALRRHLKAAKQISAFDKKEIGEVMRKLQYDFPKFTVETVYKELTK